MRFSISTSSAAICPWKKFKCIGCRRKVHCRHSVKSPSRANDNSRRFVEVSALIGKHSLSIVRPEDFDCLA